MILGQFRVARICGKDGPLAIKSWSPDNGLPIVRCLMALFASLIPASTKGRKEWLEIR